MTRILDRGAVFAGWVGVAMAVVVAMSFGLIVAVQSLVFLAAVPSGLLIGFYADARSGRRRPFWRAIVNALYAGLVTGVSLALLYAGLRFLFVYADTGYRDAAQGGPIACRTGVECTYRRYLDSPQASQLAAAGVGDAAAFEHYVLREELDGALTLTLMVLGGALFGGAMYGLAGAGGTAPETKQAG